jgi:hypothetical protein
MWNGLNYALIVLVIAALIMLAAMLWVPGSPPP